MSEMPVYREVNQHRKAMERYDWQERPYQRDDRSRNREADESSYRGAYRLDTDSRHHNQSTYGGFDRGERDTQQHGGGYVYRRSRNLQDNDNYTRQQHRKSPDERRAYGRDHFGSRYGGGPGMQESPSRDAGERRHEDERRYEDERIYYNRGTGSIFDVNYGPDRYRPHPGENYGNMAGSLSYGYDGGYNSDPDYNRRYNPLTGELRSYREDYPWHPKRYGPPDNTASNPDYDRY
jgi:hypothetical protein